MGLLSAGWIGLVLAEAHRVSEMPVPTVSRVSSPASVVEPGDWVARLDAPSVRLAATILEGSDDATLGRAAGHIEHTAFPGEAGNVGIAGHRDTTFRRVEHLKVGDAINLITPGKTFEYRVTSTTIVKPSEVSVLAPTEQPTLTLVTCYPFSFLGHAPKRYIVKAEIVH